MTNNGLNLPADDVLPDESSLPSEIGSQNRMLYVIVTIAQVFQADQSSSIFVILHRFLTFWAITPVKRFF